MENMYYNAGLYANNLKMFCGGWRLNFRGPRVTPPDPPMGTTKLRGIEPICSFQIGGIDASGNKARRTYNRRYA